MGSLEADTGGIIPRRHLRDSGPPLWLSEHAGAGSFLTRNHTVTDTPVHDIVEKGGAQGGIGRQIPLYGHCGDLL